LHFEAVLKDIVFKLLEDVKVNVHLFAKPFLEELGNKCNNFDQHDVDDVNQVHQYQVDDQQWRF
jgi:hypothetical protein